MKRKKYRHLFQRQINYYNRDFKILFHQVIITSLIFFVLCRSGLRNGESVVMFGSVNSKRIYSLEQDRNGVHLMMRVEDGNQETSGRSSFNNSVFTVVFLQRN